eukprot:CAMPEP_0169373472 /NCGR_PEP_ID=MMETSP1017-20121227/37023_1 /TAXON_ID=342587 /ORGANISM="Karlodinium micrum, Strain CCMP2283" /LENGTH=155 /DNA_ID=CAMNT_0009472187 /DNA_START=11 /DNA_END=478 /DNA_ORIENTATION=-
MGDDGSIAKELMLIFRDQEATANFSPEVAGFVWPQPGWLRTRRIAEELPQKADSKTTAKAAVPQKQTVVTPQLQQNGFTNQGKAASVPLVRQAPVQHQRHQPQGSDPKWQSWQDSWSWQGGNDTWQWSHQQSVQHASWSASGKNNGARMGKGKGK